MSWIALVSMGRYAPYVWGALLAVLAGVACEQVALALRQRAARQAARRWLP